MLADLKEVLISLPHNLIEELDFYVQRDRSDRNDLIKEAMKLYLREQKKQEVRDKLRAGYLEMARLNQELADEAICCECRTFFYYEESLAECE